MIELIAQAVNPNIKTEVDFYQYAILSLVAALVAIFYLYRDSYNARILDKEILVKIHSDLLAQLTLLQIKSIENQVKNIEVLEGLKKSLDTSNDGNENLINVLNNEQVLNLKQKIKDLQK